MNGAHSEREWEAAAWRRGVRMGFMEAAAVARGSARSKSVMARRDPLDYHQVREIKAGEGWFVDRSSGGWSLQEGQV
jgi:hypothetical protein